MLIKRDIPVIPCVNYLDFPDTKSFGDISIDGDISTIYTDDPRLLYMEDYAKSATILFCPFSEIQDIQVNEKILPYFRLFLNNKRLKENHKKLLKNAQDCRNSFNAGRPEDPLERVTKQPQCNNNTNNGGKHAEIEDNVEEFLQAFVQSLDCLQPDNNVHYYDKNSVL